MIKLNILNKLLKCINVLQKWMPSSRKDEWAHRRKVNVNRTLWKPLTWPWSRLQALSPFIREAFPTPSLSWLNDMIIVVHKTGNISPVTKKVNPQTQTVGSIQDLFLKIEKMGLTDRVYEEPLWARLTRWSQRLLLGWGQLGEEEEQVELGLGEHGSGVLLTHTRSEGYSDTQLEHTSLKVRGEVNRRKLWESAVYRQCSKLWDWMKA